MRLASPLLAVAATGSLALAFPRPSPQAQQDLAGQIEPDGPGFSILLAVETAPSGAQAIVAWAYGRSQCTERQLVSRGTNFCDRARTFNRVPELSPGLAVQPDGAWSRIRVRWLGCDERSAEGDYGNVVVEIDNPDDDDDDDAGIASGGDGGGGDDDDDDGESGAEGGVGGGEGEEGAAGRVYACNADRELHGCDYNGEQDTDLTVFLSCGDYAYTAETGDDDGQDDDGDNDDEEGNDSN